jgi:hypothetical protein
VAVCCPELERVRPGIVGGSTARPAQVHQIMMPNGFARWRIPRETGSQRVEPAGVPACAGKDWCMTHPIGQRCTDDQPTIKGRTSANFGYSKPTFAYVHRIFADQFIASARAIFF